MSALAKIQTTSWLPKLFNNSNTKTDTHIGRGRVDVAQAHNDGVKLHGLEVLPLDAGSASNLLRRCQRRQTEKRHTTGIELRARATRGIGGSRVEGGEGRAKGGGGEGQAHGEVREAGKKGWAGGWEEIGLGVRAAER